MAKFYNLADQKLFEKYQFLPQEQYRLGLNLPTDPVPDPVVDQGIVNTNSFANSGGGGDGFNVYNPDPNSIVNKEYDPYPYRNASERSFVGATDPKYLNQSYDPTGAVADAQKQYRGFADIKDKSIYSNYKDVNNMIMDNRQNYGAQGQFETVPSSGTRYSTNTEAQKMMDNYPGYYEKEEEEPSKIRSLISRGINLIPGIRGLKIAGQALGSFLPTNRRSIMENELAGQGIRVNDTGQIVGDRNTLEGVLAGKNASKVTGKTFDKQIATLEKTLGGKYGLTAKDIADIKSGKKSATDFNLTTDLIGRLRNNIIGKGQFLDIIKKTDTVYGDKKNKNKDNTIAPPIDTNRPEDKKDNNDGGDKKNDTTTTTTTPSNPYHGGSGGVHSYGNNEGNTSSNTSSNKGSSSKGSSSNKGSTSSGAGGGGGANRGRSRGRDADDRMARGGRAGYFFGGRAGYAEGGPIYSRLGTLSSGVQSAEQQLQGINASLQKAESDLGSDSPGGGSSLAGGPSFTSNFEEANNQGPGSNLLYGGGSGGTNTPGLVGDNTLNNTTAPFGSLYGGDKPIKSPMPVPGNPELAGSVSSIGGQDPARQAYEKAMQDAKKQRADGMMGRVVLPGEMSFEDFSGMYNSKLSGLQPLPSTGGGLGGFFPGKGGMEAFDGGLLNNQLPTGQPQPISEERMNSLNRSIIGNGFYDLNKGLGGLL